MSLPSPTRQSASASGEKPQGPLVEATKAPDTQRSFPPRNGLTSSTRRASWHDRRHSARRDHHTKRATILGSTLTTTPGQPRLGDPSVLDTIRCDYRDQRRDHMHRLLQVTLNCKHQSLHATPNCKHRSINPHATLAYACSRLHRPACDASSRKRVHAGVVAQSTVEVLYAAAALSPAWVTFAWP